MALDDTQGFSTEASRAEWADQMKACSHAIRLNRRCVMCGDIASILDQYPDPEFAADLLAAVDQALDHGEWK